MLSRCKETIKTNKEKYTQISTEKDQLNKQLLEKNNELEKVKVSVVSLTVYAKLVHRQPDQISIFFLFGDLKKSKFYDGTKAHFPEISSVRLYFFLIAI